MSRAGVGRPTLVAVITLLAVAHSVRTDSSSPNPVSSPATAVAGYVATPTAPPVTLRASKIQGTARSATSRSGQTPPFFLIAVAGMCLRRDDTWTRLSARGTGWPSLARRRHAIAGRAPPAAR